MLYTFCCRLKLRLPADATDWRSTADAAQKVLSKLLKHVPESLTALHTVRVSPCTNIAPNMHMHA